ncbi:MAG TPA: hypothetical protein PLP42_22440 [Acidobacteriota bacterium]|nr:hypothetical protein [Acidobacteriota bacterium]
MDLKTLDRECRRRLVEQQITLTSPGTILSDFQTLLDWIQAERPRTKSKLGNLPASAPPHINSQLARPIDLALERPLLRDYPNIAGLYALLRVTGFIGQKGQCLEINADVSRYWTDLNPTERYFGLLEAWLIHASDEVFGAGRRNDCTEQLSNNLRFLAGLSSSSWTTFEEDYHTYWSGLSTWNTHLQMAFGLIDVQARPQAGRQTSTRGWLMEKAKRTEWGEAVAWAILESLKVRDPLWFELPPDADYGFLQPAFRRYFPEWQKTLPSTRPGSRQGLHIFKVSLDPRSWRYSECWRRLAVPHDTSLDELAMAVLDAFDFDDSDHLYEFRFRDSIGKTRIFHHWYTQETPSTEALIGDIGLPEKATLQFRFDFGDEWEFLLRLERVEPNKKRSRRIEILESHGVAPEQYPGSDDWGDDDFDGLDFDDLKGS